MTLEELRDLSRGIDRIPSPEPGQPPPEVAAYNEAVGRFRELLAVVRNRLVLHGTDEPAGAEQLRQLAASLAGRGKSGISIS
jgi:predicted ATPase